MKLKLNLIAIKSSAFPENGKTALLKPGQFSPPLNGKAARYKSTFRGESKAIFDSILVSGKEHLLIKEIDSVSLSFVVEDRFDDAIISIDDARILYLEDVNRTGTIQRFLAYPESSFAREAKAAQISEITVALNVSPGSEGSEFSFAAAAPTSGDDSIVGDNTDETLEGLEGNDTLEGRGGNDTLIDGPGSDSHVGGDGDDVFVVLDDYGTGNIYEGGESGEVNGDTIDATGMTEDVVLSLAARGASNNESGTITSASGSIQFADIENILLGSGNDLVEGTNPSTIVSFDGSDTIFAGDGNDTVQGRGGDDVINGEGGNDELFGGSGNDTFFAGNGNDTVQGQDGDDLINGGGGHDELFGGAGEDAIGAGDGDDTLHSGDGTDNYIGGSGDDVFNVADGFGLDNVYFGGETGETTGDQLNASSVTDDLLLDLSANDASNPENGDLTITVSGTVTQSIFIEEIESFILGQGDDTLIGSSGNDSVAGHAGDDFLEGNAGNDTLGGGLGNDTLIGGTGNDVMSGLEGNDLIIDAEGADTLAGVQGDDTFVLNDNFGFGNRITGGTLDETAGDLLDVTGIAADIVLNLSANGIFSTESGLLSTSSGDVLFSEIESIDLGDSNNFVIGSRSDDTISTGRGNDTVSGGAGNDEFTLSDNPLFVDRDVVVLSDGDGNDTINLFDTRLDGVGRTFDQIDVSGMTDAGGDPVNAWDVTVSEDVNGDAVLTFPGGESVTLVGVSTTQVDSASELFAMGIPCFASGTRIATRQGNKPVEEIDVGDLILTADCGFQPVRWIGARTVSYEELKSNPNLVPIVVRKHAFGNTRQLIVSPQHGLFIRTGTGERLIRAKHAAKYFNDHLATVCEGLPGVTYIHLMFDLHQLVFAEGCPAESFYPGPVALRALSGRGLSSLLTSRPDLARVAIMDEDVEQVYGKPTRPYLLAREARQLAGSDHLSRIMQPDSHPQHPVARPAYPDVPLSIF